MQPTDRRVGEHIDEWVSTVQHTHSAAGRNVLYTVPMPPIEQLMQPWPEHVEHMLLHGEVRHHTIFIIILVPIMILLAT